MSTNETYETPRVSGEKVSFITNLTTGTLMDKMVDFEIREQKRITRFATNVDLPSTQDFKHYLTTLLHLRVEQTTSGNLKEYRNILRNVRVPARMFTLLAQIGIATDADKRFEFTPNFVPEAGFVPMAPHELVRISECIQYLLEEGYVTIPGIPLDREGSLEFMAKTKASDIIKGIDVTNPAYAFLAAILENEVISGSYDNLDLIFRVNYSTMDVYNTAFVSYFTEVDKLNASNKQ